MTRRILVIEDDAILNTLLCNHLTRVGYDASAARRWSEAEAWLAAESADLIILDVNLPDADGLEMLPHLAPHQPVIILTAYGSVQTAVRAVKAGAAEYLVKPINIDELEVVVSRAIEMATIKREHSFIKDRLAVRPDNLMVGAGRGISEVRRLIEAVAPSDMTVLIQGESGAGKELVAQAIHARSKRDRHTFVAVDCCTLQRTLFESELFGHEKGAFTGADRQKKGLIEGAEDGTLFLDEIGEIEPAIQAKLLRVLETGRYRRLGGTKDLSANVRIVAATNRDLAAMSRDGQFRPDLFYRLNGFVIHVPPLRERREDISQLAQHFVRNHDFSRRINKEISQSALDVLKKYNWPGNIRELRNFVERAIILSGDAEIIGEEFFSFHGPQKSSQPTTEVMDIFANDPPLEEIERYYIAYLLKKYGGHRSLVAQKLGISERNIYRLIRRYELD